jgi:hypothetical protein
MIMANFDAAHGIGEPPEFLQGFKDWCAETGTKVENKKDVRQKLNKISQVAQKPTWYLDAQKFYAEDLAHGGNELILAIESEAPQATESASTDTGNEETLTMPVGGVEGGEPEANTKSEEEPEAEGEEKAEDEEEGGEEQVKEEVVPEAEIEGVEPVKAPEHPAVKTMEELDAENGEVK